MRVRIPLRDSGAGKSTLLHLLLGKGNDGDTREVLAAVRLDALTPRPDDEIGEGGIARSAGERQLIALARAMVSPARRIYLDEPTSALDGPTEAAVMRELSNRTKGKTVVLVAHRLQPLRDVDRLVRARVD